MGANDNGDLGFQERGGGRLLDCPPSGMYATPQSENVAGITMSSMPMCKSSNVVDSFFGSGWDPFVSQAQNGEFKISSVASSPQIAISPYSVGVLENQGISSSSHLVHYPSDPALVDLARFGSGSFSEMVSSFGLSECGQIVNSGCPDYPSSNKEVGKTSASSRNGGGHGSIFLEDHHHSVDEGSGGTSAGEKRRTPETHYQFNSIQSAEAEQQKDVSVESLEGLEEQDKKKQKTEQNRVNLCGKLTGKQAKDNSQIGEAPKEDYIHVRARRGQATNSHSLAERVRREKISERMRFLQDLVPGCNKITGKAVMLDEIINYVQSLQRQVEFLSMKLATVNPELNIDIERILSKDIRAGGSSILGFAPGMSSSLPHPHITAQGALPPIQRTNLQLTPMLQIPSVWDDELQRVLQLGFISNPNLDNLEQNGCTKVEL